MVRLFRAGFFLCAFLASALTSHAQFVFDESFSGGTLNPALTLFTSSGYTADLSQGSLLLTKPTGIGNGIASVTTNFQIRGDFTAEVTANRVSTSNLSEMGLSSPLADIFFVGSNRINGNVLYPNQTSVSSDETAQTVKFRLERVGNTLTELYDSGSGFVAVQSKTDPSLSVATSISLFNFQEYGETTQQQVSFSNLSIRAQGTAPAPEPGSAVFLTAFMVGGGILFRFQRNARCKR